MGNRTDHYTDGGLLGPLGSEHTGHSESDGKGGVAHYDNAGNITGHSKGSGNTQGHYGGGMMGWMDSVAGSNSTGRSVTNGNHTSHYGSNGSKVGESVRSGDTISHYDNYGNSVGQSVVKGSNVSPYSSSSSPSSSSSSSTYSKYSGSGGGSSYGSDFGQDDENGSDDSEEARSQGYDDGYEAGNYDGKNGNERDESREEYYDDSNFESYGDYEEGFEEGYDDGYTEGQEKAAAEAKDAAEHWRDLIDDDLEDLEFIVDNYNQAIYLGEERNRSAWIKQLKSDFASAFQIAESYEDLIKIQSAFNEIDISEDGSIIFDDYDEHWRDYNDEQIEDLQRVVDNYNQARYSNNEEDLLLWKTQLKLDFERIFKIADCEAHFLGIKTILNTLGAEAKDAAEHWRDLIDDDLEDLEFIVDNYNQAIYLGEERNRSAWIKQLKSDFASAFQIAESYEDLIKIQSAFNEIDISEDGSIIFDDYDEHWRDYNDEQIEDLQRVVDNYNQARYSNNEEDLLLWKTQLKLDFERIFKIADCEAHFLGIKTILNTLGETNRKKRKRDKSILVSKKHDLDEIQINNHIDGQNSRRKNQIDKTQQVRDLRILLYDGRSDGYFGREKKQLSGAYLECYDAGWQTAVQTGYNDGFDDSKKKYSNEPYLAGYQTGRQKAVNAGYADGKRGVIGQYKNPVYAHGYNMGVGYSDGYYGRNHQNIVNTSYTDSYKTGWKEAIEAGQTDGYNGQQKKQSGNAYLEGHNAGREEAVTSGYEDGYNGRESRYCNEIYLEGYNQGRQEALYDGRCDGFYGREAKQTGGFYFESYGAGRQMVFRQGYEDGSSNSERRSSDELYLDGYEQGLIDLEADADSFDSAEWMGSNYYGLTKTYAGGGSGR